MTWRAPRKSVKVFAHIILVRPSGENAGAPSPAGQECIFASSRILRRELTFRTMGAAMT